jgi:NADPH-dependent ferric siderophore reductase
MTLMLISTPRAAPTALSLLLVANRQVAGDVRRISLVGDDLEGFVRRAGQRVALTLQAPNGALRRDYLIQDFDPEELRLDLAAGGADDPAMAGWARSAGIGDPVIAEVVENGA